jgi:hypothetical protein
MSIDFQIFLAKDKCKPGKEIFSKIDSQSTKGKMLRYPINHHRWLGFRKLTKIWNIFESS